MQAVAHRQDSCITPVGQRRRGLSDLARFPLDLTWARAEPERVARTRDYPSPPMSGSPPLPPKHSQEAGDRSQESYQTTGGQDAFRGVSSTQGDYRLQMQQGFAPSGRPLPTEPPERLQQYSYARPEVNSPPRPMAYPPPSQMMQPYPFLPLPGPASASAGYPPPVSPRPPVSSADNPHFTSPKTQRKTKGHVASACVPCKRAHLRYAYSS